MQTLPNGVKIRDFYSPRKVREDIFRRVQEEFTKKFPMENDSVRIELDSIGYDEKKKSHSLEDYQNAVLTGGRLATPLRAKVRLVDKKFNVPLEEKDVVLANVPYMTDDGTFVIGGNHYITNNQARLKSGVYARAKDNGELESHINVKSGTGPSMRIFMEPENGVFRASIDKSNIKLYPILNALGVPDEKLREVWGDEILKKNQEAWDRGAFSKFYGKLLKNRAVADAPDDEKKLQILDHLSKAELDPEVTTRTLGRPHSNLSLDTIVDASHKLLKVNRGEEEEDDRDHPANRTYHSVDDFMAERVSKDAGMLAKNLLYRTTYDRSLKQLRPGYFTPQLEGLVVGNQLTQLVAGLNPMELYDQHKRVVQLGEGGVGSMESIPMSCYSDDTEVFTKDGWVLWSQVTPQTLFACRIDGRLEFHLPHRVVSYAYSGQMYGISTVFDLLVTPNHRHWIQKYRGGSSLKRCGAAGWEFEFASNTHRKPRNFAISHEPFLGNSESKKFEIGPHSFDLGDFAEFIGWYVSEGHWDAYALSKKKGYRVVISQSSSANPEKVKKIRELLVRMGVRFSYSGDNFVVNSRHLFEWVGENCGIGSANKRLPEIVFSWPYEARCRISEAMVLGDGHEYISGHEVYHTTSPLLMGHLVQLWILNGVAASPRKLYFRPDAKPQHAQPYSCSALTDTVRGVTSEQRYDDCYSIHSYSGMVYCAEVPGGLLLVRRNDSYPVWSGNSRNLHAGELGMVDPIRSSESRSIGVDQRFTMSAMKGDDNHVYYPLKNKKTGQIEYLNAVQLAGKSVAFPQAHSLQRFFTPPPVPTITPTVAPPAPMTPPAVEPVTPDTSGHIKAADLLDLICPMPKAADLLSTPGVPASPATPPAPSIMPTAPGAPVVPRKKTFLSAVKNGKIDQFPDDEVDYELASPNHQFTETSVMVPLTSTIKGARTFIASKYATQALPLVNPDSPLVDVLDDDTDDGYTKTLGRKLGLKSSDFDGIVKKVSEKHIDLTDLDGKTQRIELKRYFPNNRKTYTSETPMVAAGDRITKGQPVARNNYVDNNGRLAIGKNLTVAFMPAPGGATFEDAIVVSESAAKKMTSPHLYGFDVEHKHGVDSNKNKFISLFPNKYTNEQLAKLDANGMVKPGVKIEPGDPVLLSFSPRSLSSKDAALGNLSKVLKNSYRDLSQTWDKSSPGIVAHAVSRRSGLGVRIATNMPLQEGDKISARSGAKGVVSRIVPDDQMVRSKDSGPVDVIINPAALIGRVNPGMVFEALLGKVAAKHGKTYNLPSFSQESYRDYVENELKAHGESDGEDLEDPETGKSIPQVLTGRQFFMKLEHTSESKLSGRGEGGSDINEQPTKGGKEGAKRLGGLQNYALLSHRADHVLEDAHVYRGSSSPEMWRRWRLGESLPPPKAPFIYDKFLNSLKAAGVNPRPDEKGRLKLLAMTDRDVDEIARYEVQVPETISHKDGSPIKGGLMDFSLHGGPDGKGWSYIKLEEPMPSPVMEEPIRRLLGITEKQMRGIIAGTDTINGRRGPQALYDALKGIKLDELINSDRETIRLGKKTKRDDAVRRVNFAMGLKKSGIEPHEMMITKVPVIPPAYRPVVVMGDMHLTSDANYLYKDLMSSRDVFRSNKAELSDEDLGDERLAIYDSIRAIQGMGDPINVETANKGVKGFIRQVAGVGGPKCYDDKTEILTEKGWVPFPKYKDASIKVATLNPETHVMEFQNPSNILHEPYSGSMVHTKTSKLDLLVTEGHWHYVEQCIKRGSFGRGRGKRTREWQPAKKVQAGELAGKTQRHRYVVSADNFVGETPEYSFEGFVPNKEAFSQFVGWWVAEGFLTFYKYKTKNLPRAAVIAIKDGTPDVARIDDMFSRLGIPFRRRVVVEKRGYKMKPIGYKTVLWRVSNYDLSAWLLKNCGSGAENKKISAEILEWEKKHQHLLLGAYLDGDGEQRTTAEGKGKTYFNMSEVVDRRSRSSTTSLELVNNIERICLQTGLGFRLTDEFFEDHKAWKKQYRFRIYGYNRVVVEYKEQTQKIENWSGMVHCVTVPNGLVFVRRNGRHVVSGNTGMFVSKVIGHPVNTVGRSVIVPNADLDMDQVGIPEKMAWEMYEPHVMRSMVREGMPATEAARRVEKHDDFARRHLLKEMERRKVMYSRDPALHRFSIMGANAVLVPGNNIHLSPLVVKPFGADFDGDQMNIHVPITDKAIKDVEERMMPSKNLFNLRGNKVQYLPSQEFILGLFGATQPRKGASPIVFKTTAEAISAYKSGAISIDQPVSIQD